MLHYATVILRMDDIIAILTVWFLFFVLDWCYPSLNLIHLLENIYFYSYLCRYIAIPKTSIVNNSKQFTNENFVA